MNNLELVSVLWAAAFAALFIAVGVVAIKAGLDDQAERDRQEREQ